LTDPDISGEPRYITRAKATKQLQVDANGVISGILLESGATSSVTIQGDQFKLIASGQSVASRNPFTVNAVTGEIVFNGKVSFNSVTDVPELGSTPQQVVDAVNEGNTTTINGGKITATSLLIDNINAVGGVIASYLQAGIVSIGNTISSNDFLSVGGGGFRLKSNAAGTALDPTIYGAYIKGGVLDGATISGQLLDISNMKVANGGYNTGTFSICKTGSVVTLYGKNYSSGYIYERCLLSSQNIMVNAYSGVISLAYNPDGAYITIQVMMSIDGGDETVISESTQNSYPSSSTQYVNVNALALVIKDSSTFNTLSFRIKIIQYSYHGGGSVPTESYGGYMFVTTTNI
jgi:hypothetical protein